MLKFITLYKTILIHIISTEKLAEAFIRGVDIERDKNLSEFVNVYPMIKVLIIMLPYTMKLMACSILASFTELSPERSFNRFGSVPLVKLHCGSVL